MSTEENTPGAKRNLSSVGGALRLLKAFTADEPELGITALAKRVGVAKSTAHRLASTLVAEGFMEQNPVDGRYRLGLMLFAMGTLVRRRMDVSEQAVPHLHSLCDLSGETVHLAVLHGTDILYLRNIESRQAIRPRSYLGVRKPAFCTSEGRALLAFSTSQVVSTVMRSELAPRTSHTVVDKTELARIFAEVRNLGYAMDDEESEEGMRGIAAPIFDATGAVVASAGLVGPVMRFSKQNMKQFVPMVLKTTREISARLGYEPDMT